MKKLLLLTVVLCVFGHLSSTLRAEDSTVRMAKGDMALGLNAIGLDMSNIANIQGVGDIQYLNGIAAQYSFTKRIQGRINIGYNTASETTKPTAENPALVDNVITNSGFLISPGAKYIFANNTNIAGYLGAEFLINIGSKTEEGIDYTANTKRTESYTAIGFAGFIGAEWFAWKNVSISFEYHLGFKSLSGKTKYEYSNKSTEVDDPSHTSFGLGFSVTHLNLNFYLN